MLGMPESNVHFADFDNCAEFCQVFAWWPKQCWITDQWLWLTPVVMGTARWPQRGTNIKEKRYYNSAEYLMHKLKGITQ